MCLCHFASEGHRIPARARTGATMCHDIEPLSWQNHVPMKDGTRADRLKLDTAVPLKKRMPNYERSCHYTRWTEAN
eukprot:s3339_g2.t1